MSDLQQREKFFKVVAQVQGFISGSATVDDDTIRSLLGAVLQICPDWRHDLDSEAVVAEVRRRFSLRTGSSTVLRDLTGHIDWLQETRKADWRYWRRHRQFIGSKLPISAVESLDRSTDEVLGLLEDPGRPGSWDRRGLVVGQVQSGKTGHYSALICKAADAGYKMIVVLAGLHNNLRSQTQIRLDDAFLGFETSTRPEHSRVTGVGEIDDDIALRPNYATNRLNNGDFSLRHTRNLGVTPEQKPWLFVVKKNKSILERLLRWIQDHVADSHDSFGRKIVTQRPLLMIDDEADHASVDTGEQVFGADGSPDDDHQPTVINSLIRKLLASFGRTAYVGYTATPFANIFIHERGRTLDEGADLFPSAFIVSLPTPSDYVGPSRMFAPPTADDQGSPINLIRCVTDYGPEHELAEWMPPKHKNGHRPRYLGSDQLPPCLRQAIDAFVLSCAVRARRGQAREHASMLVHVTRFKSVQNEVYRQVGEYVKDLRQRITRGIGQIDALQNLHRLWTGDFMSTFAQSVAVPEHLKGRIPAWDEIAEILPDLLMDIRIKEINGGAKDTLDYTDHQATGLKVIAIGGDKLSRGLTLEGLTVSYFLRASRMYDTLMQMGRWFGYRPGYLDLCRLYTSGELVDWYGHITEASEELREEFDLLAASGSTPREYGLKVQSHSTLLVTSQLKMRCARDLLLSFSGQILETVVFRLEPRVLQLNLDALRGLVSRLGLPRHNPEVGRPAGRPHVWKGSYLWSSVPAAEVAHFLDGYSTHPAGYKVNSQLISQFVSNMAENGELTSWTVLLLGGGEGGALSLGDGIELQMLKRKIRGVRADTLSIGRLLSPRDEAIDLDSNAWAAALELTRSARESKGDNELSAGPIEDSELSRPSGPAVRRIRGLGAPGVPPHPERGVLFITVVDPSEANAELGGHVSPVAGFGVSLPASDSGRRILYKVNNVAWEQEFGPSE